MTEKWFMVLISVLSIVMLPAFGAEVGISRGSSDQGCEETNSCYVPHRVSVVSGQQVTWNNNDSAAHTVTSGTATEGPDGKFDSGIIPRGKAFSYKFETLGEFPYYCMVHPWMEGIIAVGADIYEKARLERQSYAPEITIKTELPLYDHGDSVVFSGLVKDLDKSNASDLKIRVIGPLVNGQSSNIVTVKQILPYRDGSFEGFFTVSGPLWQDKGIYKIVAEYGAVRAETKFFFNGGTGESHDAPTPIPNPPIAITVFTDKKHYNAGDTITVSGSIIERLTGFPVTLQIIAANGNLVTVQQIKVSGDNSYQTAIGGTDGALWGSAGTYTAQVIYGTETRSAKTTFEFGGIDAGNGITDNGSLNTQNEEDLEEKIDNLQNSLAAAERENQNLTKLNFELKAQVEALQKKVDDLTAIVNEQIKVIYQWVISR